MKLPTLLVLLVACTVSVLTGLLLGVAMPAAATAADSLLTHDGQSAPRWDLARDTVPADLRHGGTYRDDGTVSLAAGESFGVPASAFPDQRNFTVQIMVSFPEVVEGGHTNVLLKQRPDGEETGFGLSCLHGKPSWARFFRPIINGMHIHDPLGRTRLKFAPDRRFSFTVAASDGMLSYYLDDAPKTKHFTILLPNDEPLWIGRKLHAGERPLPRMEVLGLTVHGPEFRYVSPKEPAVAEPRAAIAGKQWAIDAPTVTDPKRPKILFYGDSISAGYRRYLLPALEGKVYAYHWCHFVAGLEPSATPLMREAAASADHRAIFFNNGLHSLHWTPEKATDEQIERQTRAIVRGFREGAPQARLFWLATTPHCARPPAPGEPVAALGDKNDVVLRINRIAAEVMREEGVEVIDVYTPLAARLDLSAGDEYHWHGPALELIAKAVADRTLEVVAELHP